MSVYPMANAPNTQPKALSVIPSAPDILLFAEEIATRSTIVKNESVHKHATTYTPRDGPCDRIPSFVIDFQYGVKLLFSSWPEIDYNTG